MPGTVPARVVLYRITHYLNLPDIVQRGMFCANHPNAPKGAQSIGNTSLISSRGQWPVLAGPRGVLNDYVPFYLGPHSVMLLNIITGYNVPQRPQREIIYVCSELSQVQALNLPHAFTDGHAYARYSKYYDQLSDLDKLDWDVIFAKQWSRTEDDNDRQRRKQAEFLVHQHVPVAAIVAVVVHDQQMANWVAPILAAAGVNFNVHVLPKWYY